MQRDDFDLQKEESSKSVKLKNYEVTYIKYLRKTVELRTSSFLTNFKRGGDFQYDYVFLCVAS